MKTFVIDASTSLKWIFQDEIDSEKAVKLQREYLSGNISLVAPNLWYYEIINGLKSISLKKKSPSTKTLENKLIKLQESSPILMDVYDLSTLLLKYSLKFNISGYDCAYVILAFVNGLTLITSDNKLVKKVNDKNLAISLKEFRI